MFGGHSSATEELKSYEKIRTESIQQLLNKKKHQAIKYEANPDDSSKGIKSIFNLPFEPVWYIPIMVIGAFYCLYILYSSGPQDDTQHFQNVKIFLYSFDFIYCVDVLLMICCKFFHVITMPVIRPTSRPKWILILELVSVMPFEFLKDPTDRIKHLRIFFLIRLVKVLRVPRILYYLYYRHSMVESTIYLKVILMVFLVALFITFTYSFSFNMTCMLTTVCDKSRKNTFITFAKVTAALTSHGFGHFPTDYLWELICIPVSYIVFFSIFGVCVAFIINDFTRSQAHKYNFKNNIANVAKSLKDKKIPPMIVATCMDFFHTFWMHRNGYKETHKIFEIIPFPLYQQIVLDVSWIPLKHSKLFKNMDLQFLRFISTFMTQKFMLEGELVFQKNHLKSKMIYIASGVIQIISEQDGDTPIMSLSAGSCIGESSLIISYKSRNTVRCKDYCEIQELDRKHFILAAHKYSQKFNMIRQEVEKRYIEAKKVYTLSKHFNSASETEGKDYFTITWIKNTLHKLMAKDDEKSKHEYQNIYLRYEMHEHKIHSMLFTAKYLDMLAITERLELDTDSIFLKTTWPPILQPKSLFLSAWEILIIGCVLYASIVIPYYSLIVLTMPLYVNVSLLVISVIWVLDIVIQSITAVRTKDELVSNSMNIFTHRLHSAGFFADIVACIPIEVFSSILVSQITDQTSAWLRLNRVLKIWRVVKMFNSWENRLHSNMIVISYSRFILLYIYAIFIVACFTYTANCMFNHICEYYGNYYHSFFPATQIVTGIGLLSKWDEKFTIGHTYLLSTIVCYIIIILAYVNFASANILESMNLIKMHKMNLDLNMIIKAKNIPSSSSQRILNFIQTQWLHNKASKILMQESKTSKMPHHLFQVMREAAYSEFLKSVPFFFGVDEDVLTDFCCMVESLVLPPNEIISYAGDISDYCYILEKGYCMCGQKSVERGYTINLMEACLHVPVMQTSWTLTYCNLLIIPYSEMKLILSRHERFQTELNKAIKKCSDSVKLSLEVNMNVHGSIRREDYVTISNKKPSFYRFGRHLETNSKEEYEYYIPFDRSFFFGWTKIFLMRKTIIPDGKFIFVWESVRSIFAIASSILFTLPVIGTCSFTECVWAWINIGLDVTAWIDMYIRLHVCYYNEEGLLVSHPLYTAWYYVTHGMLLDLLGCFPINLCVKNKKWRLILQGNRMIQMERYIRLKRYLYFDTNLYVFGYIPMIVAYVCYGCTIVLFLECTFSKDIGPSEHYTAGVKCHEDSWMTRSVFTKPLSPLMVTLYGMFLAMSILSTAGIQGFLLSRYESGLVTSVLSFFGVFFHTYIMANVVSHFSSASPTLITYQEAMRNLRNFMRVKKVEVTLQKKIIYHFELKWSREGGKNLYRLLNRFNNSLRQDLIYDSFGRLLFQNSVFGDESEHFFRNLVIHCRHNMIIKGGRLVGVNDIRQDLIMLFKGTVEAIAADGTVLAILSSGSMFGNLEGVSNIRQTITIIARGHSEILTIPSTKFYTILHKYPNLMLIYKRQIALHGFFCPGKDDQIVNFMSTVTLQSVKEAKKPRKSFITFNPNSRKTRMVFQLLLHTSCFFALILEMYQQSLLEYHPLIVRVQYGSDFAYMIYFFMKYHMQYETEDGDLVTDASQVRKHHINNSKFKWRFIIDLISLQVFDSIVWLTYTDQDKRDRAMVLLRVNRFLRVFNIFQYFSFNRQRLAVNIMLNEMEFVFVWTVLLLHLTACVLTLGCCMVPNNMVQRLDCDALTNPKDRFRAYIRFLNLIVNFFTNTAQDNYLPDSWQITLLLIVILVIYEMLSAVFFAQIFTMIYKSYFTRAHFATKIDKINHFLQREEVSKVLVERIHIYIQRLWMRQRGVLFPVLLDDAPPYLEEAVLHSAYSHHIDQHPVFSKCHVDFRRHIVAKLRDNIYFPGDYIAFQQDINEIQFFIHKGEVVAVLEDEMRRENLYGTFKQGSAFGVLQGLTKRTPYRYNYRASRLSVVCSLQYNSWEYLLDFFPASKEIIDSAIQVYLEKYNVASKT